MKVCNEVPEKILRYKDLKRGDVFKWATLNNRVAVRGIMGIRTYLDTGEVKDNYDGKEEFVVIRYSNACLILGDPA